MSKPSDRKRLFIALALSAIGFSALATLLYFYSIGSVAQTQPLDHARGLTGEFIAEFYDDAELAEGETTVVRTEYLDGSYDIAIDVSLESGLFVSTLYSVERTQRDAVAVYGGFRVAAPLLGALDDVDLEERDELFDWGASSSSKVILIGGVPAGHVIVAHKGKVAFSCTISGLYLEERGELEALLAEMLTSAERDS